MHFFSKEFGLFGGHGIVGAHVPVGIGIAFAHKYKGDGGVCIVFLGDGAVGQGAFHEACNLAGVYKLPVIVVVENNQYAMGTAVDRVFAETDFYRHAPRYNMHGALVNGMNVLDVYAAMKDHVELARNNEPSLLEIRTYRYRGHSMSDPQKYRTKEEMDQKKTEDPIVQLKLYLTENEIADNELLDSIDDEVKRVVLESVEFADNSPQPDESAIYKDVYGNDDYPFIA